MRPPIVRYLRSLSLAERFMLASFVILVSGMAGVGWWIGRQIEIGVTDQTASVTALYVASMVAPQLQELGQTEQLSAQHIEALDKLQSETPLGEQIVSLKIWDRTGRVLYSSDPSVIGRVFPMQESQERAWNGEVTTDLSDLQAEENEPERARSRRLLETYSPVHRVGTSEVIAVAEFYQEIDDLQREIDASKTRSWLVVGLVTVLMYALLAGFVRQASDTIDHQQLELHRQVDRLTELLAQNEVLHERVRRAATRTAALNERYLRRISAELHDGPAQDLALALLRLDSFTARCPACARDRSDADQAHADLDRIQASLSRAMQEVRAISAGLRLPELEDLTLTETLARVVRVHERRTDTKVVQDFGALPEQASLPVKITLFRVIQEALSNAYRHGGGVDQRVRVGYDGTQLTLEVSDRGPGFDASRATQHNGHLGLVGMRERVESLGGVFRVESGPGRGTKVIASLALQATENNHERQDQHDHRGRSPVVSGGGRPHPGG